LAAMVKQVEQFSKRRINKSGKAHG
jgi:hypothetical protein